MKTPNTNPKALKAHEHRPAKGVKLVIKDSAAFEPGTGLAFFSPTKHRRVGARAAAANTTPRTSGHYSGAELKPYQGRPGSLDFLALPSLMGKTRVYRADQNVTEAQS
jgi:hypothetical protein